MSLGIVELLIYVVPALAGVIASPYLSRLANFILMIAIFQIDLAILIGNLRAGLFTPYTVLCIAPAIAGMIGEKCFRERDIVIGSRYFLIGKLLNALLIIAVFYIGGLLLAFLNRGKFIPLLFLQAIFVSAGSLVPPLVFILVSIVAYRLRRSATP